MALPLDQEQMLIEKYSTTNPLEQVLQVAKHLPQDQASKILRYSLSTGDAPTVVANNLRTYEMEIVDQIDWDSVVRQAPKTAAFLNDPLNMAIVRNKRNINYLSEMETTAKAWTSFWNGVKGVGRSTLGSLLGATEFSKGKLEGDIATPKEEKYIFLKPPSKKQKQGRVEQLQKDIEMLEKAIKSTVLKRRDVAKEGLGQEVFYGVLETAPQVAAQMAMYGLTGGTGAVAFMGGQIQGGQYLELKEKGVKPERAFKSSLTNAAMQVPLEQVGLGKMFRAFPRGGATAQKAMDLVERAATESATEFLQKYPESITDIVAKNPGKTNAEYSRMFINDFVGTTKQGLLEAAIAAPFGLIGGVGKLATQKEQSEALIDHIEQIQDTINKSELVGQSPELIEKHLNEVYNNEKIYVDPQGLTLYQDENPEALGKLGLTSEEVEEAAEKNELVEVPLAKYTTVTAQDPAMHEALKDDITPDPNGITRGMFEERIKTDAGRVKEIASQTEEKQALQTVRDDIKGKLIAAGVNKYDAEVYAATVSSFANVAAKRYSEATGETITPQQWIERKGLTIEQGKRENISWVDAFRGRAQLGQNKNTITLFANADKSTFTHEISHVFFADFSELAGVENVSEQVKQDWAELSAWLGIKGNYADLDTKEQTRIQEQFARGFEAYLREGKAPSSKLKAAFRAFKRWLVSIYRDIKQLNVNLSPEVLQIMDRMLATEEEIEEQRILAEYRDWILKGELSEEETAVLKEAINEADEEVKEKLLSDLLAETITPEELKAERNRAKAEITKEVNEMPIYKVIEAMAKPLKDGSPRLNRNALVEEHGEDILKKLNKNYYADKGTATLDLVADLYGFQSGIELLNTLINVKAKQEEIETRLAAHMEQFTAVKKDAAMQGKVREALRSPKRLEVLLVQKNLLIRKQNDKLLAQEEKTEQVKAEGKESVAQEKAKGRERLEAQKEKTGQEKADLKERLKATRDTAMQTLGRGIKKQVEALLSFADDIISVKAYREATAAGVYISAEKKASRKAVQAAKNGEYAEAEQYLNDQILNHALTIASIRAKKNADRIIKYFNKFAKRKKDSKFAIDKETLGVIDTVLSRYGFRNVSNTVVDVDAWAQEIRDGGGMVYIANVPAKHYRDLTIEELNDVADMIRSIEKPGRDEFLASKASFAQTVKNLAENNAVGKKYNPPLSSRLSNTKKFLNSLDSFDWAHKKAEAILEVLDGPDVKLGKWWSALYKPIQEASNAKLKRWEKVEQELKKLWEVYTPKERKQMASKQIQVDELGGSLTKIEIIGILLNWGNKGNRQRLLAGRKWTQQQIETVLDKYLEERDFKFAQSAWDYLDSFWPEISQLTKDVTGITPKKVQSTEIVFKYGTFKGGYYPLKRDSRFETANLREAGQKPLYQDRPFFWTMTDHGHTKERAGRAEYVVELDPLKTIPEHIHNVIHDLTHRRAVIDANRILRDNSIRQSVSDAFGPKALAQLEDWLIDIAAERPDYYPGQGILRLIRTKTTQNVIAYNAKVFVTQFVSIPTIGATIGYGNLARSLFGFYSNPADWNNKRALVMQKSAEMRNRTKTFDRDVWEQNKRLFGEGPGLVQFGYHMMTIADNMTAIPVWYHVYMTEMAESGDEARAINLADKIIRETHSSGMEKDISNIQRGNELRKMFSMFYTYFNARHNVTWKKYRQVEGIKDLPQFLAYYAMAYAMPALLADVLTKGIPDDEEDKWKWLAKTVMSAPFADYVIARDIVSTAGNMLFGGFSDYRMSSVEGSIEMVIRNTTGVIKDVGKGEVDEETYKKASKVAFFAKGIPAQFEKWLWIIVNIENGDEIRFPQVLYGDKK